jgi:hypothetical protein
MEEKRKTMESDKGLPAAAVKKFDDIFKGSYGANNAKARRWWSNRSEILK